MTDEAQRSGFIVCGGCAKRYDKRVIQMPAGHEVAEPPEAGWYLPFRHFGYYNGFDDRAFTHDEDDSVWLCHDCIVKMLEALPILAEKVGVGGHYNLNHTGEHEDGTVHEPCCRFAWTSRPSDTKAFDAFVVGADGKWKLRD